MVYPGYRPEMPRTPIHQNAGTLVGTPRCPGGMATPRFSAPIPVHTTPPGTLMVAASMVFPSGKATNLTMTSVLPQHSGQKQLSSQDAQDNDSPAFDSRPTAFTMDPPVLHRLPVNIDETTDMGQQGDEELVPEGEYNVFCQVLRSSRFHSSGDNADDFLEEIGSLVPTDEVLKDKITWDIQSSLKVSLTHCAKIAQGVLTTDKIIDTHLCDPPTAQKNKFKFFTSSDVLDKEHYGLNVESHLSTSPRCLSWHLQWDRKPRCLSTWYQARTCFRLKSSWGGWPSMDPLLIRWWRQSWSASRKRPQTRLCRNRSGLCISPHKRP